MTIYIILKGGEMMNSQAITGVQEVSMPKQKVNTKANTVEMDFGALVLQMMQSIQAQPISSHQDTALIDFASLDISLEGIKLTNQDGQASSIEDFLNQLELLLDSNTLSQQEKTELNLIKSNLENLVVEYEKMTPESKDSLKSMSIGHKNLNEALENIIASISKEKDWNFLETKGVENAKNIKDTKEPLKLSLLSPKDLGLQSSGGNLVHSNKNPEKVSKENISWLKDIDVIQGVSTSQTQPELESAKVYYLKQKIEVQNEEPSKVNLTKLDPKIEDENVDLTAFTKAANNVEGNVAKTMAVETSDKTGWVKITNMDNIQETLHKHMVQLKDKGKSTLTVQLQPEELGKMKIQLEMTEGILKGTILVENDAARNALQQHIQSMRNQIKNQGIMLESLEVNIGNDSFHEFQQQADEQRFQMVQRWKKKDTYSVQGSDVVPMVNDKVSAVNHLNILA